MVSIKTRYWDRRRSERDERDDASRVPGVIWRSVVCLALFFVLLGARNAGSYGSNIVSMAKQSVEQDMSYDDVKSVWLKVRETLLRLPQMDLGAFWTKAVTGQPVQLAWPTEGAVTSYFGWRANPTGPGMSLHQGIDIDAPKGTAVVSALDGVVKDVRQSPEYGNVVEIDHNQAFSTVYAHLDQVMVAIGQKVKKGEIIGTVGDTGNATASHLHFEVRKDGLQVDPMTLLPPRTKEP